MSDDRDRGSDGLLIGILVVLVVLVLGGVGFAFFGFRFAGVARDRAIMAEQLAREQAEQARMQEELARQADEHARVQIEQLNLQTKESAPENEQSRDTPPADGSSGERDERK